MDLDKRERGQLRPLVGKKEEDQLSRNVLIWLNTFPEKPVAFINYEYLEDNAECMALSTVPGAYITAQDILGGYDAEYQFKVIYRILHAAKTPDRRLKADELLDALGDWASGQQPYIGEDMTVTSIRPATRSHLYALYENGDEDHQILMKLAYHVSATI